MTVLVRLLGPGCAARPLRRTGRWLMLSGLMVLAACGRGPDDQAVGQRAPPARGSASEAGRQDSSARDVAQEARQAAMGAASQARAGASAAGNMASDARITATVKMGLAADKDLSAGTIEVDTQDGLVTLKGPAPTMTAKARAGEIARNVRDVRSVDNQLVVPGG